MERPGLAAVVVESASLSLFFFFNLLSTGNVNAHCVNNILGNIWIGFHPLFQIPLLCGWVSESSDSVVKVNDRQRKWEKVFVTLHSGPLWTFSKAFYRSEIYRGLIVDWWLYVLYVAYQFGFSNAVPLLTSQSNRVGLVWVLKMSSPQG